MHLLKNAMILADYISSHSQLVINNDFHPGYMHMGAIITDTVLQSGLNYRTVVLPRVKRVLSEFPSADRTSEFKRILNMYSPSYVIEWKHEEKLKRLNILTDFFVESGVDTENELREWLKESENAQKLLSLHGIGAKSVDYIKKLVGLPAIPVDRHIRTFVSEAGINYTEYEQIRTVIEYAADFLEVSRQSLDHAIWTYYSRSKH